MIQCPVCSHQNGDLALLCASCGSYVQERVPTLDFFAMVWMLIEAPGQGLKKIVLAEHKNYVLMIAVFFGISAGFGLFWSTQAGNEYENIAHLIIAASGIGLVAGIPLFLMIAGLSHGLVKLIGGNGSWRNTYAMVGWGMFPFTIATTLLLPIELAVFGLLLFSNNPHPFEVKPVVYAVLIGMDGLLTLWSLAIGAKGLTVAHGVSLTKSIVVLALASAVSVAVFYLGAQTVLFAP
jgi:hypothetical protein